MSKNVLIEFWEKWFGPLGREIGIPERIYTQDPKTLIRFIKEGKEKRHPVYMSVQPYCEPDKPEAIEKLFFDFDNEADPTKAWKDALTFSEALRRYYNVDPLIVFSGNKGYHVYVFVKPIVIIKNVSFEFAKEAFKELQERLLKGLNLPTLDPQPIGDLKRLSRVPFSIHEKTKKMCVPVDHSNNLYIPDLNSFKPLDASLFSPIVKDLKINQIVASLKTRNFENSKFSNKIRPCIKFAIRQPLEGPGGHLMRLCIAREYLAAGYTIDEIVQLFSNQIDFDPEKTRYYIEHAKKNPTKPFKCSTIKQLGYCIECKKGEDHE